MLPRPIPDGNAPLERAPAANYLRRKTAPFDNRTFLAITIAASAVPSIRGLTVLMQKRSINLC
jgi:hypothetical protein